MNRSENPRYRLQSFSLITKLTIGTIGALSISGRELYNIALSTIGHEALRSIVTVGVFFAATYGLSGLSLSKRHVATALGLISLGGAAYFVLGLPEERVHLILFTVLGASLCRDLSASRAGLRYAILIGVLIGGCDELFQAALPWRVGDLRDAFINAIGVVWGVLAQNSMTSRSSR